MERKNLLGPFEWKAVAGSTKGELDGYGVFFNNIDLGDDVALPGSAKKTLADRAASGRPWPLIADHELATTGVVGSARDAREDGHGVRLRAEFASTAKAQDLRTLVLEGHVDGMSITYEALRHHLGQKDGRQVRFLDEIRIHEFTITPFPMNPQARIVAAKGGVKKLDFAQFAAAMRSALDIGFDPARKAAVNLLVAEYNLEDFAAGPADELDPTADAAASTPDGAAGTAVKDAGYALGFLASPPEPHDGALNPLAALETARATADLDRVEAEINQKLGRTAQ